MLKFTMWRANVSLFSVERMKFFSEKVDMAFPRHLAFVSVLLLVCGCVAQRLGGLGGQEIERLLARAEQASREDDYTMAARCYVDAIVKAEELALPETDMRNLKSRLATTYLDWARFLYWDARSRRSVESCTLAMEMACRAVEADPSLAPRVKHLTERLDKEIASIAYKKSVEADIPDLKGRNIKIASLCRQGAILNESGLYIAARDKYEQVLVLDPYNIEATRWLMSVSRKLREAGLARRDADAEQRLAASEWSYVSEIAARETQALEDQPQPSINERLYGCILDGLDFEELPLDRAFTALAAKISAGLGQKFSFNYEGFNPRDLKWPPLTFKTRGIPASEAIRAICDAVGLDFNYSGEKVVLSVTRK